MLALSCLVLSLPLLLLKTVAGNDAECLIVGCCEWDCCGEGTYFEETKCREDLESPGFVGWPPDQDFGCASRICCEDDCCGYGTRYDPDIRRCTLVLEYETVAPTMSPKPSTSTAAPTKKEKLCVFKGFEDKRYQEHDDEICECVKKFNADKAGYAGSTAAQAAKIPDLDPNLVKSLLIQETGGGDARSRAAWKKDPAQVNVPGDWTKFKEDIGLKEPKARNQGNLKGNLDAAIRFLVRKGFGSSGQPAKNRPTGVFDDWKTALERYNGRTVITTNGKKYRENYADRITDRVNDKENEKKIELPKPKKN